ncbi:MAG: hypothetical protein JWM02_788 [Frankiales bacterium]|nr:hypothetical protein [Frankiales bacterium]
MGWEDLVCAACAGRVVEGRCATCRASREQFRGQRPALPAAPLLIAAALLLALLMVLAH